MPSTARAWSISAAPNTAIDLRSGIGQRDRMTLRAARIAGSNPVSDRAFHCDCRRIARSGLPPWPQAILLFVRRAESAACRSILRLPSAKTTTGIVPRATPRLIVEAFTPSADAYSEKGHQCAHGFTSQLHLSPPRNLTA